MSIVIARSTCDEAIQTFSGLWIASLIGGALRRPMARNDDRAYFFAYETPMPARTSLWMP
jgi:hypothetical protein